MSAPAAADVARHYERASSGPLGNAYREIRRLTTEKRMLAQVMAAAVRELRAERDLLIERLIVANRQLQERSPCPPG